jgi:hypothetical protein
MKRLSVALAAAATLLLAVPPLAGREEPEDCAAPAVEPVLDLGDRASDRTPKVGEPFGDGRCELFCGVTVLDTGQGIPQCASYPCTFRLRFPKGETLEVPVPMGPTFDGMTQAQTTGTDCLPWDEAYPPGRYAGRLECAGQVAELAFTVVESFPGGFTIPESQWHGVNHCPERALTRGGPKGTGADGGH